MDDAVLSFSTVKNRETKASEDQRSCFVKKTIECVKMLIESKHNSAGVKCHQISDVVVFLMVTGFPMSSD